MKKLTVLDYANLLGVSIKTIYKRIDKGQVPCVVESGKKLIVIEDSEYNTLQGEPSISTIETREYFGENKESNTYQDAELINDLPVEPKYKLLSMEQTSFDQLIQSMKELATDQVKAYQDSYSRIEREYLEFKAENKELRDKNEKLKIESVQAQTEVKIIELRVRELENINRILVEENNDIKGRNSNLESEVKNLTLSNKELEDKLNNSKFKDPNITTDSEKITELVEQMKEIANKNLNLQEQITVNKGKWFNKI